jgi:hypothetical protein
MSPWAVGGLHPFAADCFHQVRPMVQPYRPWRIATHESAHCVVAAKLGLPRRERGAHITEDSGRAHFATDCGTRSIVALMAGVCGEIEFFGAHDEAGARVDMERIRERLQRIGYTDHGAALWRSTLDLVHEYSDEIAEVATHLMEVQSLDGSEIDRILRG